jgi:hypothetical protein
MTNQTRALFLRQLRALRNIPAADLPELTFEQYREFRRDMVLFVLQAGRVVSNAIWREIEKRMQP